MISFDEFKKIELRAGTVLTAKRVDGSEKLLCLEVDLGRETRQIIAGIGKTYAPETLIDRQIIIVANLEPRMLIGLESQGMLLAAHTEAGPALLTPDKSVPPGAEVK